MPQSIGAPPVVTVSLLLLAPPLLVVTPLAVEIPPLLLLPTVLAVLVTTPPELVTGPPDVEDGPPVVDATPVAVVLIPAVLDVTESVSETGSVLLGSFELQLRASKPRPKPQATQIATDRTDESFPHRCMFTIRPMVQ